MERILRHFLLISIIGTFLFLDYRFATFSRIMVSPFLLFNYHCIMPLGSFFQKNEKASSEEVLRAECATLREQNIQLRAQVQYLKDIEVVKTFAQRYAWRKRLVQVLFLNMSSQAHYCLVDSGSAHGIVPDMIAVAGGRLIGRVAEVFPYYSKIVLITDSLCKVPVFVGDKSVVGVYEGGNDSALTGKVSYVPLSPEIEIGSEVFSSGQGMLFPRGFLVGTVIRVHQEGLHYLLDVKVENDFSQLRYCYLLSKGEESLPVRAA